MSQMTLYGSLTSPFVRRVRILLGSHDYRFEVVSVFDAETRAKIAKVNPLVKIPILVDGKTTIYDSRQIYHYLMKKMGKLVEDDVNEANLLTVVDGTTDALITLFYLKSSGLDGNPDAMIVKNNQKRVKDCFEFLNEKWAKRKSWKYADICLITLLDWVKFRNLVDLSQYPNLSQFQKDSQAQPFVKETLPRDPK